MAKKDRGVLVGKVLNEKFAYFWLLIGGGLGNMMMIAFLPAYWPYFLPPAVFSILISATEAGKLKRHRVRYLICMALTCAIMVIAIPFAGYVLALPSALIILGCILGIGNW
jgi:hypothetical protein